MKITLRCSSCLEKLRVDMTYLGDSGDIVVDVANCSDCLDAIFKEGQDRPCAKERP